MNPSSPGSAHDSPVSFCDWPVSRGPHPGSPRLQGLKGTTGSHVARICSSGPASAGGAPTKQARHLGADGHIGVAPAQGFSGEGRKTTAGKQMSDSIR